MRPIRYATWALAGVLLALAHEAGAAVSGGAGAADATVSVPIQAVPAGHSLSTLVAAAAAAVNGAAPAAVTIPRDTQVPGALRIKRVTAGPDGKSYLDVIDLPIVHHEPGKSILSRLHATDVELGYGMPGSFIDWHRVTTPRLWIILQGAFEFGTGDGQLHRLEAGDIVLAADTTGQGHTSRNVGDRPSFVLTVRLPAADSLKPKTTAPPVPQPEPTPR
jgi:hypothetical protein